MSKHNNVTRRGVIRGAAVSTALLAMPAIVRAQTSSIVVASSGGKLEAAYREAYYQPFTEKTGIEIVGTSNTYAKLKAMVDADAVEWDVAQVDAAVAATFAKQNLLEPLDYSVIDKSTLFPGVARDLYMPSDFVGCVVAWNTDAVRAEAAPRNWKDVWDLNRISGKRGFWKQPFQTMEVALMADGVQRADLYPLDVDRALASLEKIKDELFWWGSGAQSAQVLIDGEISVEMGWNGRLIEPKADGAPVDYHFNDALFVSDAWIIPKGAKNKKASMDFIAFALEAERQAVYSSLIPYGPVNPAALQFISKDRLPELASSEQNYSNGILQDFEWWAENGDEAGRKFNQWMLG